MSLNMDSNFLPEVKVRIKEHASVFEDGDLERYIKAAVEGTYSKDRPRQRVKDTTGAGSGTFDYTLNDTNFPGWEDDFSQIQLIEYPLDDTASTHNYIDRDEWEVFQNDTPVYVLRFKSYEPLASEEFRVWYLTRRVFDDESDVEVPAPDQAAVYDLCAADVLSGIASYYLAKIRSTQVTAERADNNTKMQDALTLAGHLRANYKRHLGIPKDGQVEAATAQKEFDTYYPWGADRLTHQPRWH